MRLCATSHGLLVLVLPFAFACAAAPADTNHHDQQTSGHTDTSNGATVVYTPLHAWESQLDAFAAGGEIQTTRTAGASASIAFTGSSVQYICHAPATNVMHFAVEIDGQPHDTQTVASVDIRRQSGVLFAAQGLDPTRPHTITITNLNGKPLCVERFEFTSCPETRCAPAQHDRVERRCHDQQPFNVIQAPLRLLVRREMRQPVPQAGLVLGGAFGGAAVILSLIVVALVAMPPEIPPHMQLLAAAEIQQRRQQRRQQRGTNASRGGSSRSRSPMLVVSSSDPSGSRTRQNHSRNPSQNPFLSSSQLDLDEGNPFASNAHLDVPYVAEGQASLLDLAPSSSGASTLGRSLPGTTSMLAPGRGFICAKCSVELSRERTRRAEQQNLGGRSHEFQSSSRLDAGPSSSRHQRWNSHSYGDPGPSTSAGHRYPPTQREVGRPPHWS